MQPILDDKINDNPDDYMPCFNCEEINYTKVKYTWWGGVLGPRLLHHVKCSTCGTHYNGRTGASNTGRIAIYSLIILMALLAVYLLFIYS